MDNVKNNNGLVKRHVTSVPLVPEDPITAPVKTRYESSSANLVKDIYVSLPISPCLLDEAFPDARYETKQMEGKYISDVLTERKLQSEILKEWSPYYSNILPTNTYKLPVLISAQTGKGKNYFVIHTLREFAKKRREKILYIVTA